MPVQPTMVPYMWRRHLGVLRAFLASFSLILYISKPAPGGLAVSFVVGAFAIYSVFVLFREHIESRTYQIPALLLDVAFFFLCAMHPTREGLWLSTVCYFYLICVSTLMYEWKMVVGVIVICVVFFLIVWPAPSRLLWPTVLLSGVFATVFSIQKEAFQLRLAAALRRSVLSRSEAERAREAERQRIAADFHDGPLQSFISFQMRLEIIRKLMTRDADAAMKELVQLQELGKAQVTELRSFLHNMQPIEVDEGGLAPSVRQIVHIFEKDSSIPTNLSCGELPELPPEFNTEILQVIREALNNVRKHSKASHVNLNVSANGNGLQISIADDGAGFPFTGMFTLDELELLRVGPKSIKRRVRTLSGELYLDSKPGQGAELRIHIPT